MTVPQLILTGANDYLLNGDTKSLQVFESHVDDAIGLVDTSAKLDLLGEIVDHLERTGSAGERVHALLDFLDRQRQFVLGSG